MATTLYSGSMLERDEYQAQDLIYGWTKDQYLVAWTFFSDEELPLLPDSTVERRADHFVSFLMGLKDAWWAKFPAPPLRGPMQVYVPEIDRDRQQDIRHVFSLVRAVYAPNIKA